MINSYAKIKELQKLGFKEDQAEAIVKLHAKSEEHLATKNDILNLESKIENLGIKLDSKIDKIAITLESKMDGIATRLESSIKELKNDNYWTKAIAIATFTVVLSAVITMWLKA